MITQLVNIYTGEVDSENVNVTESVRTGIQQMTQFQRNLPKGFLEKLLSKVIKISERKNTKNLETIKSFRTDLVFLHVVYLVSMDQLDISILFIYELAPGPTSLFKGTGYTRYTSTKSVLKNKLNVEVSSQTLKHDVLMIDGGGMLY